MITLELPYPPSANRYWRSVTIGRSARVLLSREAQAFKQHVGLLARVAGVREPIVGRVALDVALYPALPADAAKRARRDPLTWDDTVRCLDLDNALKVVIDAIKDVVIADDRFVRRITAERCAPDAAGARLVLRVSSIHVERSFTILADSPAFGLAA